MAAHTFDMTSDDRAAWMNQWRTNLRKLAENDPHVVGALARLEIARNSMGDDKFNEFMRETFAHYLTKQ